MMTCSLAGQGNIVVLHGSQSITQQGSHSFCEEFVPADTLTSSGDFRLKAADLSACTRPVASLTTAAPPTAPAPRGRIVLNRECSRRLGHRRTRPQRRTQPG